MHQALSATVCPLPFGVVLSSLALLVGLVLHAAPSRGKEAADLPAAEGGVETDDPRSSTVALARRHFLRGVEMYRAGAYDAALAAFTRAYELAPNYRILYNLAQVQAQRQDYVQALELFGRYLREGSAAPGTPSLTEARVAEVQTEMTELKHRVAELRVETNVEDAILVVNESRVSKLPLATPLWLNAGIHRMRVEKPGHVPVTKVVTVAGGDAPLVSFELERETFPIDLDALPAPRGLHGPAPGDVAPPPALSTALGVGLVSTGVLAAATAACGVLTYRQSGELDRRLSHYPEGLDRIESARSRLRTLAMLTDAFGLASVLAAGVTTYFHLSTPRPEESRKRALGAAVGPDGVNLWLTGEL
jgi:tetratricopeptide (TPR) repeat protein